MDGSASGGEEEVEEEEVVHCSQLAYLERRAADTDTKTGASAEPPATAPPAPPAHAAPGEGGGVGEAGRLCVEDLSLVRRIVDHGAKDSNPVDKAWFFYKDSDETEGWEVGTVKAHRVESSKYMQRLPLHFQTREFKVFCKDSAKRAQAVTAVAAWCANEQAPSPHCLSQQDQRFRTSSAAPSQACSQE